VRDLAPEIHRQRLVIEGIPRTSIGAADIVDYLQTLSGVLDMRPLMTPATHCSDLYGWAGWIHWENSGAHFYAWDEPRLFFSVDIYTCKAFAAADAVEFTGKAFEAEDLEYREF
jgi:hypothetical protein